MTPTSWRVRPGKIVLKTRVGPVTDRIRKARIRVFATLSQVKKAGE